MKRIISMAVVLVITMAAMAQKGDDPATIQNGTFRELSFQISLLKRMYSSFNNGKSIQREIINQPLSSHQATEHGTNTPPIVFLYRALRTIT